jgi:hypothetical protein
MINVLLTTELSVFEIAEKLATITIAVSTLIFSFYIYNYQLKKDNKSLKLDWYRLIIIESKFEEFFVFFMRVNSSLEKIKNSPNITEDEKSDINQEVLEHLLKLRLEFVSLLLAVDKMLYDCVLHQFDELYDSITIKLADEDLNLFDKDVYEDEITKHISSYKTKILKMFVDFKGANDTHKVN